MKNLLKFKDMYLINSNRYKGGFVQEGKYTESELNDMITNQGYIPVANASEFNSIRTEVNQTMGIGTPWVGIYLTGTTKKYVQIYSFDTSLISPFSSFTTFSGVYDGNEVLIDNLTLENIDSGQSPFGNNYGDLLNIRLDVTINNTQPSGSAGGLVHTNNSTITNCTLTCDITTIGRYVGGLVCRNVDVGIITNCQTSGEVNGDLTVGGLVGLNNGFVTKSKSFAYVNAQSGQAGGLIGYCYESTSNVNKSSAHGNVSTLVSGRRTGGFVGLAGTGVIDDCYATGNVTSAADRVGGFVGENNIVITNCYSIGSASGTGNVGGFSGVNSGTVTDSYWDTEASGNATSTGGTGKTTTEMQQGTIPDTAIYVGWSDTIWDEVDNTHYPILL